MTYCDLCSNLTVARLYPPSIYHHAESVSALQESSRSCDLCALLDRVIMAADSDSDDEYDSRHMCASQNTSPLLGATDAMFAREGSESHDQDSTSDNFGVKLQILRETQRKNSTVDDLDGFTHIGIWTHSKLMISSLTLMVQEGKF